MLGFLIIAAAFVFAIIVPIWVLIKYYSPKQFSTLQNIFWIVVAILTWPLVPIVLASRRKDKLLIRIFWISFLVMAVAAWYWSMLNVNKVLQMQQMMQMHV